MSEEQQTYMMGKGVVSGASHSIYAYLRTPSHTIEKITPVIEASKCKLGLNFYIIIIHLMQGQ